MNQQRNKYFLVGLTDLFCEHQKKKKQKKQIAFF